MYELVPFRASQLFYDLDWKINGEKCTCSNFQKYGSNENGWTILSRNMAQMKKNRLYSPGKVQQSSGKPECPKSAQEDSEGKPFSRTFLHGIEIF